MGTIEYNVEMSCLLIQYPLVVSRCRTYRLVISHLLEVLKIMQANQLLTGVIITQKIVSIDVKVIGYNAA